MRLRDLSQEVVELGPRGALFRASWEIRNRLRAYTGSHRTPQAVSVEAEPASTAAPWLTRLPLADPEAVAANLEARIQPDAIHTLRNVAEAALTGRILCFDRWFADYGNPIDWHLNPTTGRRWRHDVAGAAAMRDAGVGDIKLTWEVGRFPHAYYVSRAAAFAPTSATCYAEALLGQMTHFMAANPAGMGVHWASGQEIALRMVAWLFALDTLLARTSFRDEASRVVRAALTAGAQHIEERIDYARLAVRNNHVLSEALGLFAAGALLSGSRAIRWRERGLSILAEETERQFYADGAYLNQSHNYQRSALLTLLWASVFARSASMRLPDACSRAMERSLTFLLAQQNIEDGRLPNYGANDGSLPGILTTCDFSDFRPLLQTLSVVTRGERLYEPGPWDEMPAWLFGPGVLDLPRRPPTRVSVSFPATGYHVLRGRNASSFSALRCGKLRDRFSQIDMLHLDVWWRGHNVLCDGGSYLYGDAAWHNHFMRTAAHNTITIDGRDQMLHFRPFKVVYWTDAAMTDFADHGDWALCAGEHYGYRRHPGQCVHHRTVIYFKDDVWVVIDRASGTGAHDLRLHWLGGAFDSSYERSSLELKTPGGPFTVWVGDADGQSLQGDVVAGQDAPPRGWHSRYYGEKTAAPSLSVTVRAPMPTTLVTILSGVEYLRRIQGASWRLELPGVTASFELSDGHVSHIGLVR